MDKPLGEHIKELIAQKNVTKAKVYRESHIEKRYFYNILDGSKLPSRDYVIRILLTLQVGFGDTQWLLKANNYAQLYAREKRDCVIIYCMNHQLSVNECDDMLKKIDKEPLTNEAY